MKLLLYYAALLAIDHQLSSIKHILIAIVIAITIAAAVVLVILLYCFRRRKASKKSNSINEVNSGISDGVLNYHGMQVVSKFTSYIHMSLSVFSLRMC